MKKIFLPVVLFMCVSFYAQRIETTPQRMPNSIYTFSALKKDVNSISSINKRLKLTYFEFVIISIDDIENNMVSLNSRNIGKTPSAFIYDDYKRYQNNNLLKGFLIKNDPTRWNLHCIENRIQPYFLNKQ